MQIFHKMISAVDIGNRYVAVGKAKKARGKLTVVNYLSSESGEPLLTAQNLILKIGTDVEDIVILNYPMDQLLFYTVNSPASVKVKELSSYAAMEIAHLLNVPVEELVVEPIVGPLNKVVAVVAKRKEVNAFVTRMTEVGLPEPDVVLPDIFKYLQAVQISLPSTVALVILAPDYSAVCVYVAGKLLGLRSVQFSVQEVLNIVAEETGFGREELHGNIEHVERDKISKIIESFAADIPYTLERELIFLLSSVQPGMSIRDLAKFYVMCDPFTLTGTFVKILEQNETFWGKVERAPVWVETNGVPLGLLGLLIRGGAEFGKNKLVQIQKTST